MTAICFSDFNSSDNNRSRRLVEYMVEVVTFDGESFTYYIEAHSKDEAGEKAASMVPDADYIMVQEIA